MHSNLSVVGNAGDPIKPIRSECPTPSTPSAPLLTTPPKEEDIGDKRKEENNRHPAFGREDLAQTYQMAKDFIIT
jgi:hypothetical protein